MTARCENCKHWGQNEVRDFWTKHNLFRECTLIKLPDHIFDECREDMSYEMKQKYVDNTITKVGAFVQDASDYSAVLYTLPDFFCARFQKA